MKPWMKFIGVIITLVLGAAVINPSLAQVVIGNPVTIFGIGPSTRLTTTLPVSGTVTANAGSGTLAVSLASVPSHAVTNAGTFAAQTTTADGGNVTIGAKADAKSTATDTTSITIMQVLKEISAMVQAPAALPANQSVNVAQINGITPLMGNGATGTGSQRGTLASDNTGIANWGHGATGSGVPAGATYIGTNGSGNLKGLIACDNTAFLDMTTATTTQIVAASGSTAVYVCELSVFTNGTSVGTLKYGTGASCGTGTTSLGPAWDFTAQTGIVEGNGTGMVYKTTASQALCFTSSAAVNVHVHISYTQF